MKLLYCAHYTFENFCTQHCDAIGIQTPSNLNLNLCTCNKTEQTVLVNYILYLIYI